MTMRQRLYNTCMAALAAMLLVSSFSAWAKRPNLVVMLADDWGYSDVGAFGSEIHTPHLNQLAQNGTRFSGEE